MTEGWKDALVPGAVDGSLPAGYQRQGGVIGRAEFLDEEEERLFSSSRFLARSKVPHTTSAVEAEIRRRHLERLVRTVNLDPAEPVLELGCADGLVTHSLLELGFEKLLSTDIVHSTVAALDRSLTPALRERVLLVVDDMLRLPFDHARFETVIAWGVLSVSGDLDRALDLAWKWVSPGGHLLLAEPILESVLVYTLVRGDLDEFRRTLAEGSRAAMWEDREERYGVKPMRFYEDRLAALPGATIVEAGGVSMLPSLILGGLVQDREVSDDERGALADLLADPALDELALWRQAYWLLRKAESA